MDKISLIVPCYNEAEAIPILYTELINVTSKMSTVNFEFIFVDDGSSDRTLPICKELATKDEKVKYISFSRNFGKEAAMYAGLTNAVGDYVAILDADMQDPPSLLPKLYYAVKYEGYDSAATRRVSRKGEPKIRSFCARLFYKLMRKISDADIVDGARDFRLMNRKFVNALLSMKEYNRFSKGMFGWVGFKTKWIEFENIQRCAGETKWSFWGLLRYSIEGIIAFSNVPLIIASLTGLLFCIMAFFFIVFIIIRQLLYHNSVNGWSSLVCIILLIGGIQLFSIGVLGHYMSQLYIEVKRRPNFIISEDNIKK